MRRFANLSLAGFLTISLLTAAAWPLPATAAAIDDFKLTRAIPADAFVATHSRDHTGRGFIDTQMQRIWNTVEAQHFEKEVRTLLKGLYDADTGPLTESEREQRAKQFDALWQQFSDLLLGVEWSGLFDREAAFAMKLAFPTPEFVLIGLGPPDKTADNFAGLENILTTLISFAPQGTFIVAKQGQGDSVVNTISLSPDQPVPLSIMLARHNDALLLGLGQTMPEQALALLRGEPGQALASTERFQSAMKRLPAPTDELMFFDMARFMGQLRSFIDSAIGTAGAAAEQMDPKIKALPDKLITAFDMFDYVATVSTTQGMKKTMDSIAVLRADAESKAFYPVLFKNGTLKEPLKFIPQGAQNFTVWAGIDLRALYDAIITFIRDNAPNGPELIQEWDANKATLPFDIDKDVLSWVAGGFTTFSMPAETAYKPGAWLFALSVTDEARAREVLGRIFEQIGPTLAESNGALRDAEVEGGTGFKTIIHPMMIMAPGAGQPTVGIQDGQLIIASGAKVISAALATAAGKEPNFSKNERFQKEGLPLPANVWAASFSDLTRLGDELGQVLKMVPMIGMFMPQIGQNPVGRALISTANKLGNVVQEINFLQSSCSVSTFDGKVIVSKAVMNYREPPPPQTMPAEEEQESPTTQPAKAPAPKKP